MFRIVRFTVRTALLIGAIEYVAPDFIIKSTKVTAEVIGISIGNSLWYLFTTVGQHMIHHS